jgi:hypothetical protein
MFVFARVLSCIGPAITMPNGLAIFGSAYLAQRHGICRLSGSISDGAFAALFDFVR